MMRFLPLPPQKSTQNFPDFPFSPTLLIFFPSSPRVYYSKFSMYFSFPRTVLNSFSEYLRFLDLVKIAVLGEHDKWRSSSLCTFFRNSVPPFLLSLSIFTYILVYVCMYLLEPALSSDKSISVRIPTNIYNVRFERLTAVTVESYLSGWNTVWSGRSLPTYLLYLQDRIVCPASIKWPWRWRQYVLLKHWETSRRLHGVTSLKIALFLIRQHSYFKCFALIL
jgi:hypothetical protein